MSERRIIFVIIIIFYIIVTCFLVDRYHLRYIHNIYHKLLPAGNQTVPCKRQTSCTIAPVSAPCIAAVNVTLPPFLRHKVHVLHNMCIDMYEAEGRKVPELVVYNSDKNRTEIILAKNGFYPLYRRWRVRHVTGKIPTHYHVRNGSVAFFLSNPVSGNLNHYLNEFYFGLYGSFKYLNRLGCPCVDHVFYLENMTHMKTQPQYHNPYKFREILYTLPVIADGYWGDNRGACFHTAVVGAIRKVKRKEAIAYIFNHIGLRWNEEHESDMASQKSRKFRVTIIKRKLRQILNTGELEQAAKSEGFIVVSEYLEDYNVKEQMKLALWSDVLVSVHGAGLEWLVFMRPGCAILEIYWDFWPCYYCKVAPRYDIQRFTLKTVDVSFNWTSFKKMHNIEKELSPSDKSTFISKRSPAALYNPYKWADVKVDVDEFKHLLLNISQYIT